MADTDTPNDNETKGVGFLGGTAALAAGAGAGLGAGAALHGRALDNKLKNVAAVMEPMAVDLEKKFPGVKAFEQNLRKTHLPAEAHTEEGFNKWASTNPGGALEYSAKAGGEIDKAFPGYIKEATAQMVSKAPELQAATKGAAELNEAKGVFKGAKVFSHGGAGIKTAIGATALAATLAVGWGIKKSRNSGEQSHTERLASQRAASAQTGHSA